MKDIGMGLLFLGLTISAVGLIQFLGFVMGKRS